MNRKQQIAFKLMPNGNIRGFLTVKDKRGVSEWQITNPENVSPTVINARPPMIYENNENSPR